MWANSLDIVAGHAKELKEVNRFFASLDRSIGGGKRIIAGERAEGRSC